MAELGKMDPFSFAGSKDVDYPVSIRMYVQPRHRQPLRRQLTEPLA